MMKAAMYYLLSIQYITKHLHVFGVSTSEIGLL